MDKLVYDPTECMELIKKKYPFIPKSVIRKVLHGEELYMFKVGIIDWEPKLSDWCFSEKKGS